MTAAPKYVSGSWKPSTATSKPFLEGVAATKILPTYCSRRSAWWSQKQNSSFFRKRLKMRAPSNSCAEPIFLSVVSHWLGFVFRGRGRLLGFGVCSGRRRGAKRGRQGQEPRKKSASFAAQ